MFYIIYEIMNLINGKIYIGAHKTSNIDDNYMGSGIAIKKAVKKYGKSNFSKRILWIFNNESEMWAKEAEIVNEQFVSRHDVYNQCLGGRKPPKPWKRGELLVEDLSGNRFIVSNKDPRYVSGELKHVGSRTGLVTIIHSVTGDKKSIPITLLDFMKSVGWKTTTAGHMRYKDKENNYYYLSKTDALIKELSLVPWTKNKKVMKINDEIIWVDSDKVTPDMNSINKDKISVRDSHGNNYSVANNDPRYISGELVAVNKGRNGLANHLNVRNYTCQHCLITTTKGNFVRWHSDNCKKK